MIKYRSKKFKKSHNAGFSLLEMVVALSVLGLLLSLLYSAVYLGIRSWESAQDRVAQIDRLRISWRFLHNTLTRTKPIADPNALSQSLLFRGSAQHLQFVTDRLAHAGLAGLHVLRLEVVSKQHLQLSYRTLADYRQSTQSTASEKNLLVDDLDHLEITYFGRQASQTKSAWHSSWLDDKHLPALIRIQIKSQAIGDWPVLIAAPYSGRL